MLLVSHTVHTSTDSLPNTDIFDSLPNVCSSLSTLVSCLWAPRLWAGPPHIIRAPVDHIPTYLSSIVAPWNSATSLSSRRSVSAGKNVAPGRLNVSSLARSSFTVAGPSIWNAVPPHVRNSLSETETVFCPKLKTYLLMAFNGWLACR